MGTRPFLVAIVFLLPLSQIASGAADVDSQRLKELFDADQAIRSEENRESGKTPTVQEERDRRFGVFQLISTGQLRTANDFFRAGIILHHTTLIRLDNGEFSSYGTENKVLAFFLFKRAHELGHKSGRRMMAAAYNYYLRACGEDSSKYGYRFEGDEPLWRPTVDEEEIDTLKCGFDPRPYFT